LPKKFLAATVGGQRCKVVVNEEKNSCSNEVAQENNFNNEGCEKKIIATMKAA